MKLRRNRKSPRMKGYDYAQEGAYFVTICAHQHEHRFGAVMGDDMHLSAHGHMAYDAWPTIPDHFRNADIDLFVVMPNHVHGIVLILEQKSPSTHRRDVTHNVNPEQNRSSDRRDATHNVNPQQNRLSDRRDVACYVPTHDDGEEERAPGVDDPTGHYTRISPKPGSLSAIIRSYKSAVTKAIRHTTTDRTPIWQGRYHDRIIRDERELNAFRNYILTNPARWTEDRYYKNTP
ncbi:MAG: hypothetical protein AAFU54_27135 [Chloroflexota bacterium]